MNTRTGTIKTASPIVMTVLKLSLVKRVDKPMSPPRRVDGPTNYFRFAGSSETQVFFTKWVSSGRVPVSPALGAGVVVW